MVELIVGTESPMFLGVAEGELRRWACTVHAVRSDEAGPPFETICGLYVEHVDLAWEWPPDTTDRSCPACVRRTLSPRSGARPGDPRAVRAIREGL